MDIWLVLILLLILVLVAIYWNRRLLRARPSQQRRFLEGRRRFGGTSVRDDASGTDRDERRRTP